MSITPTIVSSHPSPTPPKRPASATTLRDSRKTKENAHSASSPTAAKGDAVAREPIDLPRRRRVKSAVTAADSRIMTVSAGNSPWGSGVWGETSYSSNYKPKKTVVRSHPRPTSATRMNNPHPSKMFLQWKIPTRIHPHSRSVQVDPVFLKDIQENFYQDYVADENKTGGAKHEVPITNVAKIPFPGNTSTGLPQLEVTGSKMSLANKKVEKCPDLRSQDEILQRTLQPMSYMAYQQWVHEASEDEKKVLAKMMKAAHIEDSGIKKALSEVFAKESLKHIKEWMHSADENELSLAINIVDQLSRRSQKYSGNSRRDHSHSHHCTCSKRLHRSKTWPKQKLPSYPADSDFGVQGKKLRPHSAEFCSDCSTSDAGSIYNALNKSNKLQLKYSQAPPKTILWHHKVKPPIIPRLLNRGALFGLPHKPKGQHFALHPEWPIA